MAPKGNGKGKGKATARAKMPTSGINQRLSFDRDRIVGSILEHILGLIRIYNVCGVNNERALDLFLYDIIFLDPVTTRHFSQFQLLWPHRRSRNSSFHEWWAAFCSDMRQIIDKTRDQMNNCRWDNTCAFGDQVDRSNPQTTHSGKVQPTGERFSWYSSDDLQAMIEPPSYGQYMPGEFLTVRPQNWDDIIIKDDDDENWADPGAPSSGRSRPGNDNDNDDGEGEEDMQGSEKETGTGTGTKDGKAKVKVTADGTGKGKAIGKQTPEGDDISRAVASQLQ